MPCADANLSRSAYSATIRARPGRALFRNQNQARGFIRHPRARLGGAMFSQRKGRDDQIVSSARKSDELQAARGVGGAG